MDLASGNMSATPPRADLPAPRAHVYSDDSIKAQLPQDAPRFDVVRSKFGDAAGIPSYCNAT
jgi:hypothetical protein